MHAVYVCIRCMSMRQAALALVYLTLYPPYIITSLHLSFCSIHLTPIQGIIIILAFQVL